MVDNTIFNIKLWGDEEVSASGISITRQIDLNNYKPNGVFGLAVTKFSGAGTIKFEYLISGDGRNFNTGASNIVAAYTKAKGEHGILYGDVLTFADVAGMTEINGLKGTVTATAAGTATVNINSTAFTGYTSGGSATPDADSSRACVITDISQAASAVVTVDKGRSFTTFTPGIPYPGMPYSIKFRATETGGASAATFTAFLVLR